MKEVNLEFSGPYKLRGEGRLLWDSPLVNSSGIYIWTIQYQNEYFIEYIGETGISFYQRIKDHMIQSTGGNYKILDVETLQKTGQVTDAWQGMWRKGTKDKIAEFLNSYEEMAPKILNYISAIQIFLAPFESNERERRVLEGALAKHIYQQKDFTHQFFPKDIRYYGRKIGEEPIHAHIQSSKPIIGLPTELTI
ncbi:hypothetical protein ACE38V_13865 [Cytobacillus sp. Hz8]|uniref:hypothetical protein n=1 Tax=Cytobacillus sp. Hz8 TaxID=3347168 RepID=UPI0035D54FA6